jgi:hypothetical protein
VFKLEETFQLSWKDRMTQTRARDCLQVSIKPLGGGLIRGVIADRVGFTLPSFSPSSVTCTSYSMLCQDRSRSKRGREDRDSRGRKRLATKREWCVGF